MPGIVASPCGCQIGLTGGWSYGMGRPVNQPYSLGGKTPYRMMGHTAPLLAGLLGGTKKLPAGAHFRQGYVMNLLQGCSYMIGITGVTNYIDQLEGCLYNTGAFTNVVATCSDALTQLHAYLLVEGDTYLEFAQASDLTGLITDNIKNCTDIGSDAIKTTDKLMIDAIPQDYAGNPDYEQTSTGPGSLQAIAAAQQPPGGGGGGGNGGGGNPSPCDWSSMSFGEYIACQLGIRDPVTGALAGATGTIIGVGVIGVMAVLIARR